MDVSELFNPWNQFSLSSWIKRENKNLGKNQKSIINYVNMWVTMFLGVFCATRFCGLKASPEKDPRPLAGTV